MKKDIESFVKRKGSGIYFLRREYPQPIKLLKIMVFGGEIRVINSRDKIIKIR